MYGFKPMAIPIGITINISSHGVAAITKIKMYCHNVSHNIKYPPVTACYIY
jgi:hypothetical protein